MGMRELRSINVLWRVETGSMQFVALGKGGGIHREGARKQKGFEKAFHGLGRIIAVQVVSFFAFGSS